MISLNICCAGLPALLQEHSWDWKGSRFKSNSRYLKFWNIKIKSCEIWGASWWKLFHSSQKRKRTTKMNILGSWICWHLIKALYSVNLYLGREARDLYNDWKIAYKENGQNSNFNCREINFKETAFIQKCPTEKVIFLNTSFLTI